MCAKKNVDPDMWWQGLESMDGKLLDLLDHNLLNINIFIYLLNINIFIYLLDKN